MYIYVHICIYICADGGVGDDVPRWCEKHKNFASSLLSSKIALFKLRKAVSLNPKPYLLSSKIVLLKLRKAVSLDSL